MFSVITRTRGSDAFSILRWADGRFPEYSHVAIFSYFEMPSEGFYGSWDVMVFKVPVGEKDRCTFISFSVVWQESEEKKFAEVPSNSIVIIREQDREPFIQLCQRRKAEIVRFIDANHPIFD